MSGTELLKNILLFILSCQKRNTPNWKVVRCSLRKLYGLVCFCFRILVYFHFSRQMSVKKSPLKNVFCKILYFFVHFLVQSSKSKKRQYSRVAGISPKTEKCVVGHSLQGTQTCSDQLKSNRICFSGCRNS